MLLRISFFTTALIAAFYSVPASAQATRTWVSGVGDDVNPCSRTAPCKTFAGAISKTAAGGEINCLDPGGFGTVTITKSMTIDCGATFGSILASATNGVNVNDSASGSPRFDQRHSPQPVDQRRRHDARPERSQFHLGTVIEGREPDDQRLQHQSCDRHQILAECRQRRVAGEQQLDREQWPCAIDRRRHSRATGCRRYERHRHRSQQHDPA